MISQGSIALRFETRRTSAGNMAIRCRAVLVLAVRELGALGTFALIQTGQRDRRYFAGHHEAEPEAIDVRELLPVDALEKLSASRANVPAQKIRAA